MHSNTYPLLGLDTKIPKNRLNNYPDNPAKSAIDLHFLSKNLTNLSRNLKKSFDFVDEYFTANTFVSVKELWEPLFVAKPLT